MAPEPEIPSADDTVVLGAPEITQVEDAWPVADFYRVEPADTSVGSESETVVVAQAAAPPPRRRFPPDVRSGVLLAVAATVVALVVGAVLLDDQRGDETASPGSSGRALAGGTPTPIEPTSPAPAPEGAIELRNVVGMSLADATTALEELQLRVSVTRERSDEPRGRILSQSPEPGAKVAKGDEIALVVARGMPTEPPVRRIGVPDVVGRSASDAVVALRDAGLEARIRLVDSSERAGVVLQQTPTEGVEAPTGSTVRLDVSRNRPAAQRVELPDVVGLGAAEARRQLRSLGFAVSIARVRSGEPAGTVLTQSPRAGAELRKGGSVTLTVSTGPADAQVPDVTGLDEESARLELESAGFEVRVTEESTDDPSQDGVVVRQSPSGGSAQAEGSVVTLVVARVG